MAWYFRVIERADGRSACRHGRQQFDTHDELPQQLLLRLVPRASGRPRRPILWLSTDRPR